MIKEYTALGLMSGTSGDGVDASVIVSDGDNTYRVIKDKYFKYNQAIFEDIHDLKDKLTTIKDIEKNIVNIKELEKKITLFHAQVVKELSQNYKFELVGFHGQTIYHNAKEKISKQLGNGPLLSQLTKKKIVYNFRENDLKNGGQGAPLTPIFHKVLLKQKKNKLPAAILNIGGIANITIIENFSKNNFKSYDVGPGNCLIDEWIRKNSDKNFDKNGKHSSSGTHNEIILEQIQDNFNDYFEKKKNFSLDTKDFDISFVRGLSINDGAATLAEFTSRIIGSALSLLIKKDDKKLFNVLLSGGGRKNKDLIRRISEKIPQNFKFQLIDEIGVNGDFVESQAFAYLAIRTLIKLPISFPSSTGCSQDTIGGEIVEFK